MRLLLCIDHFGPGGAQRQLVSLARGLKQREHEIEFFVYRPEYRHFLPQVEALGITVHEFKKGRRLSLGPIAALARKMRGRKYDAVLAFLRTPAVYAELAGLTAGAVPIIVSERLMLPRIGPSLRLQQELHRLAAWITVNSHHQREQMVRSFPWMGAKISTIYNGVDLEVFMPAAEPRHRPHGLPVKLLAVASTARKKNALGLAKALALLRQANELVPLVHWAGPSPNPEDAHARREVEHFIREHNLSESWKWLGTQEDIPKLLADYDALIHPSYFEGLPNAICEALACGLPVLASRVCDHPLLVGSDRGFLFDPSEPTDIAHAISALAGMRPIDRAEMGKRARKFAIKHLSLERYATEYETLLLRLINGNDDARPSQGIV